MMQRWELPAFGRDNRAHSGTTFKPDPKEVLVKVEAVSLNYRDLLILENGLGGGYGLPLLPGSDFAGVASISRYGRNAIRA
jgi:NADPH:quinone reductase-like Zn-dependent oxidoreductase